MRRPCTGSPARDGHCARVEIGVRRDRRALDGSGNGFALTADYTGEWLLARTIVDQDAATSIACSGRATLFPENGADRGGLATDVGTLRYSETVSLELGGRRISATQTYRYHRSGDTLVATFAGGAPFFTTTLGPDGTAAAEHQCGPDRYRLELRLHAADRWTTCWRVSGGKSLVIATSYRRAAGYTSTIPPYVSGRRSR